VRFVDLFSGTGGMRLGFEQACASMGIQTSCVLSSEIDRRAVETYELNFGHAPVGDIRQVHDLPAFDFMLAGFPCQPFSYAGKRQGFGDTRGTLFYQIERLLRRYRPEGFLLENVRGLTTHDKGRTFQTIIHDLKSLGYGVRYVLLNSSNFSVPQNRVRIYIVGLLERSPSLTLESDRGAVDSHAFKRASQSPLFSGNHPPVKLKDVLQDEVDEKYYLTPTFERQLYTAVNGKLEALNGVRLIDFRGGNSLHSWDLGIKGECSLREREFMVALISNRRKKVFGTHQDGKSLTLEQIRSFFDGEDVETIISSLISKRYLSKKGDKYNPVSGNMSFEVFKFLDPESISITLTSSDANKLGIVHNGRPRRITPRECARLQGFPDSYQIHPLDPAAYKQFGNAVSVPVIREVVQDLLSSNRVNSALKTVGLAGAASASAAISI